MNVTRLNSLIVMPSEETKSNNVIFDNDDNNQIDEKVVIQKKEIIYSRLYSIITKLNPLESRFIKPFIDIAKNEGGSCNYCAIGFTSYNGNCFEKEDKKCDDENCVSCIEDGKICIYCSLEYALSSDHKCVSNKNTINNNCAKYDSNKDSNNDNICSICHFGYLMNYDYKGCRKYNNRSGK